MGGDKKTIYVHLINFGWNIITAAVLQLTKDKDDSNSQKIQKQAKKQRNWEKNPFANEFFKKLRIYLYLENSAFSYLNQEWKKT